ncbi:MAG: DUF1822 family protein [Cyanomargarita calcarea GSE-NOS-MK-12-04C]|jgi:hypothetical protein|uniref:DUF1822 family protein n=1 Tax=Cyanomargarita calcarea GSE-NOS-MK-12-04C TaxID=2839659 RepID=A0A951QS37_9CYAN|nr:DUF1822 family protein [Cyanomargarita calcarea GSE-NOS-MK-12-04C]
MMRTAYPLLPFALPLPISSAARRIAQQFSQGQLTKERAEQVMLNTLAVCVVNDYLQMMEIPTDLQAGDIYNPVMRVCTNIADLVLPGVGRLECRPVRSDEQVCSIPPETWEERVGYVVVEVDESLQEAKLLGFVRHASTEELSLSQLQPPEALIEHLGQLRQPTVNLGQWFAGMFDAGWETLESLWNQPEFRPAYAFRSGETVEENPSKQQAVTRRAKLINLGIQIANQPVILLVEISPQANEQTNIRLQVHSAGNEIYLPQGVHLTILDESGAVFLEAQSRSADNYIQLQFRGELKERFSVKVALDEASVTQNFVI